MNFVHFCDKWADEIKIGQRSLLRTVAVAVAVAVAIPVAIAIPVAVAVACFRRCGKRVCYASSELAALRGLSLSLFLSLELSRSTATK